MKKLLLTSIATLFLATGTAHAIEIPKQYRGGWCSTKQKDTYRRCILHDPELDLSIERTGWGGDDWYCEVLAVHSSKYVGGHTLKAKCSQADVESSETEIEEHWRLNSDGTRLWMIEQGDGQRAERVPLPMSDPRRWERATFSYHHHLSDLMTYHPPFRASSPPPGYYEEIYRRAVPPPPPPDDPFENADFLSRFGRSLSAPDPNAPARTLPPEEQTPPARRPAPMPYNLEDYMPRCLEGSQRFGRPLPPISRQEYLRPVHQLSFPVPVPSDQMWLTQDWMNPVRGSRAVLNGRRDYEPTPGSLPLPEGQM